jgi:hypothetical protein
MSLRSSLRMLALCLLAAASLPARAAQGAPEVNADTLVARWAAAIGGRVRLARVTNVYERSRVRDSGLDGTDETWTTADGRSKSVSRFPGLTLAFGFDGRAGWQQDANGSVRALGDTEREEMLTGAYLASFSHLLSGRLPGRVEYTGEDRTHRYYVLKLMPQGGREVTCYLDKRTYLPFKTEQRAEERTATTYLSDWRRVDGVLWPHRSRTSIGARKYDTLTQTVAVRFNVPLDERAFAQPAEARPALHFAAGDAARDIPFELQSSNHIFVQVRVNRSAPLWFIFDTGAEGTIINARRLRALGLSAVGDMETRGEGANSLSAGLVRDVTFRLPGVELAHQTVAAVDMSGLEPLFGRTVDGVLGYDFIGRFVAELDYTNRRLTLYDPRTFTYRGRGTSLPIVIDSGTPHVEASLTLPDGAPLAGKFLLDTGAGAAVTLASPFVKAHNLRAAFGRTVEAPYSGGLGGESKTLLARGGALRMGDYEVARPLVALSAAEAGAGASPDEAGIIGGGFLHHFKVTFDYAHGRMFLEPYADKAAAGDDEELSGISLVARGPNFGRITVNRVVAGSPAARAGLRVGDVVVAVNDEPARTLTLSKIGAIFKHADGAVRLTVRRGASVKQLSITPEKLI